MRVPEQVARSLTTRTTASSGSPSASGGAKLTWREIGPRLAAGSTGGRGVCALLHPCGTALAQGKASSERKARTYFRARAMSSVRLLCSERRDGGAHL